MRGALGVVISFAPDLILYLAGADPYREDQLGGLSLTLDGLKQRDRMVFEAALAEKIPVAVVLARGYARRTSDTVDIHCNTAKIAEAVLQVRGTPSFATAPELLYGAQDH